VRDFRGVTELALNSRNTSNLSSLPFLVDAVDLTGLEWTREALDAFASPPDGYAYAIVTAVQLSTRTNDRVLRAKMGTADCCGFVVLACTSPNRFSTMENESEGL